MPITKTINGREVHYIIYDEDKKLLAVKYNHFGKLSLKTVIYENVDSSLWEIIFKSDSTANDIQKLITNN